MIKRNVYVISFLVSCSLSHSIGNTADNNQATNSPADKAPHTTPAIKIPAHHAECSSKHNADSCNDSATRIDSSLLIKTNTALPGIKISHPERHLLISENDTHQDDTAAATPEFIRHYNSGISTLDLGLGPGWTSNFHSRINFSSETRLDLLTPTGSVISFHKTGNLFLPKEPRHGTIVSANQYLVWTSPDIGKIQFKGSLPVRIDQPEQQSYTLYYRNNKLVEVKNQANQLIRFLYHPDGYHISELVLPGKNSIYYTYKHDILSTVGVSVSDNHRKINSTDASSDPKDKLDQTAPIRKYWNQTTDQPGKALVSSISLFSKSGNSYKIIDALYDGSDRIRELINHKTEKTMRFSKTRIQYGFHGWKIQERNTNSGNSSQSGDCEECRKSVEIHLDDLGNAIGVQATGVQSGSFTASWQVPNGLLASRFKIHSTSEDSKDPLTTTGKTVQIVQRDNSDRPITLSSDRFNKIEIEYETTENTNHIKTISNKFNSIKLQDQQIGNHPELYKQNDPSPEIMALEAKTIIQLDNIARGYLNQQCLVHPVHIPNENEIDEAVNSLPLSTEQASDSHCDQQTTNPATATAPVGFSTASTTHVLNNATTPVSSTLHNSSISFVDIRPEDCSSYFDIASPIARGSAIEQAIAQHDNYNNALHTAYWFPVVDFVVGRTAVVQISRDLTVASYTGSNQQALYNRLLQEGAMINERFLQPLNENGFITASDNELTTTITQDQIDNVHFELILQQGAITPGQLAQIELARIELMTLYNITLSIVLIP